MSKKDFFDAHVNQKHTFCLYPKLLLLRRNKKSVAHNKRRAFLKINHKKKNYNYGFFDPSLFSSIFSFHQQFHGGLTYVK